MLTWAFLIFLPLIMWTGWTWNRLVALRAAIRGAWASTDALLKRRADLVPNLVALVRGSMDYESDTLKRVTEARTDALAIDDISRRAAAEAQLTGTVRQLFALVESYPELKSSHNILQLQDQLAETENDIASARRYYNAVVRDYDIMRESFPNFLVARPLGFEPGQYFDASEQERMVPAASLGGE
jgi:LemA protein